MSKQNLGKARGLNSLADPSEFRGKSARPPRKTRNKPEESPEHTQENPKQTTKNPDRARKSSPAADIDLTEAHPEEAQRTGSSPTDGASQPSQTAEPSEAVNKVQVSDETPATRRRGRPPITGNRRIRRELSVPAVVAEAVEQTGMNPADLVMNAYRRHSDEVYTGTGARMAARGRKRLRISLSDGDFDKISRLGEVRNWNRSETVSVLLSLDLLASTAETTDA